MEYLALNNWCFERAEWPNAGRKLLQTNQMFACTQRTRCANETKSKVYDSQTPATKSIICRHDEYLPSNGADVISRTTGRATSKKLCSWIANLFSRQIISMKYSHTKIVNVIAWTAAHVLMYGRYRKASFLRMSGNALNEWVRAQRPNENGQQSQREKRNKLANKMAIMWFEQLKRPNTSIGSISTLWKTILLMIELELPVDRFRAFSSRDKCDWNQN